MDVDEDGLEGPAAATGNRDLLCAPSASTADAPQLQRATAAFVCRDERFRLEKRTYDSQYAPIYFCRLEIMTPMLLERVAQGWPGVPVSKILDLPEGQEVAVVGTIYKEMKLKPSILDEYNKERGLENLTGRAKLAAPDDTLVLEDASARMALRGDGCPPGPLVTGVVAAVRGAAAPGGDFDVKAVLFAHLAPQPERPRAPPGPAKYVALLSGLGIGEGGDPARLALAVEYLGGFLGGATEQAMSAQVVRTVVAGGLLASSQALEAPPPQGGAAKLRQPALSLGPLKEADMVVAQLAAAMPVDVMAGAADPANQALPQQALHACLLPNAAAYPTLHRVTNPHEFEVDGVAFLGTSGQNVADVLRYSEGDDAAEALTRVLEWGHLVPTAPDTLAAYPFAADDPFVLRACPHVLFAGNQPEFATRMVTGREGQRVRLVCVPRFCDSGTLVLVNLATMAVHPITFDASLEA
ncbi:hypothetical protein WJX81_000749 [Elliptochloris bilobata]|uniref:DNA polymerase delta small subunit n=1 Tax=Elliptochloris bilobata TaxID=381761 RepID=A0AAW1RHF1_9CHLO